MSFLDDVGADVHHVADDSLYRIAAAVQLRGDTLDGEMREAASRRAAISCSFGHGLGSRCNFLAACHPERSEGSAVASTSRSLASRGMTDKLLALGHRYGVSACSCAGTFSMPIVPASVPNQIC